MRDVMNGSLMLLVIIALAALFFVGNIESTKQASHQYGQSVYQKDRLVLDRGPKRLNGE